MMTVLEIVYAVNAVVLAGWVCRWWQRRRRTPRVAVLESSRRLQSRR